MPRYTIENGVRRQFTEVEEKEADALITAEEKRAKEYAKVKYRDDRKAEYPEIGDQLDDLYKKGAFSDEMSAKLKKVKADNPKP